MPSPTPGQLYVKAMAATQRYMDGVRAEQWHAPTPNTEWDVKQVANHVIDENLWAGTHDPTVMTWLDDADIARTELHLGTVVQTDTLTACDEDLDVTTLAALSADAWLDMG
jgi:hypothetical protein